MWIKVLKSVSGTGPKTGLPYTYGKGFEGDVPDDVGKDLTKTGINAIAIKKTAKKKPLKKTKP